MTTSCASLTSGSRSGGPGVPSKTRRALVPSVGLDAPVAGLRGAGPVTAARLAAAGVRAVRDLLLRLPRGYDDLRRVTPLAALDAVPDGSVVVVRGEVRRVHVFPRRLLDMFAGEVGGVGDVAVRARWFRPHAGMSKSFCKGAAVALAGPLRTAKDGTREMVHPSVVTVALAEAGEAGLGIRPRYAPVEGVSGRVLERLYASALESLERGADEWLPAGARERLGLPSLAEALRQVHAPSETTGVDAALGEARRRIALEDLIVGQLAFLLRRAVAGPPSVTVSPVVAQPAAERVEGALGFTLTASQRRALADIAVDLGGSRAMQRLLVGDVGSGKTAVAFAAAAMVAAANGSTLMMVPTEALAEQQAAALAEPAARVGLSLAALTGSTPAATRAAILRDAAAGRISLLVGTQALLSSDVDLRGLGLVIVDEQHRFGVAQRARLGRTDGRRAPHLLAMSATPIPRSLALALHGDLDASILLERPAGRPPPAAVLCLGAGERASAYARIREEVGAGRQAFVACAVREEARRPGAVAAVAHHRKLAAALAPARVGLLHGGLPAADKEATLRAFAGQAIDVLVATTVVELGIDVPNATVMVIEEADRFGIAQLHQLRGRVGRGRAPGVCFLCADGETIGDEARARLGAVAEIADGFRLAELDLAQRGFGDLLGTRQAGGPLAAGALAELGGLIEIARTEAEEVLRADPELAEPEHALLARAARARAQRMVAGEAG